MMTEEYLESNWQAKLSEIWPKRGRPRWNIWSRGRNWETISKNIVNVTTKEDDQDDHRWC